MHRIASHLGLCIRYKPVFTYFSHYENYQFYQCCFCRLMYIPSLSTLTSEFYLRMSAAPEVLRDIETISVQPQLPRGRCLRRPKHLCGSTALLYMTTFSCLDYIDTTHSHSSSLRSHSRQWIVSHIQVLYSISLDKSSTIDAPCPISLLNHHRNDLTRVQFTTHSETRKGRVT